MGLDVSHDAWHGAYSAFSRWRNKIAEVAGYTIAEVEDEEGIPWKQAMIDWGRILHGNPNPPMGEWEKLPEDPLLILIAHSDCDGVIHPREAELLAERLEEILPLLEGDGGGHIGNYREKTQTFIDGLRLAVKNNEDVEFS